jgi:hypothetical protein
MFTANAVVISRWFAVDQGYFARHPDRRFRVRGLYPSESVAIDEQRRGVPPPHSPILKIIKQVAPGRHEVQAMRYRDKAAVVAALDSDAAAQAAFDLLSAEDVIDVRQTKLLATLRETGRLQ